MKQRIIAIVACFLALSLIMGSGGQCAKAWSWTADLYSEPGTSDSFKYYSVQNMPFNTNIHSYICGGDVSAVFYNGTQGMQAGFVRATSRVVDAFLVEKDSSTSYSMAHMFYATFVKESNDYYHPGTWNHLYTYNINTAIESDGVAELCLRVCVYANTGDTTTSVPGYLFKYQIAIVN